MTVNPDCRWPPNCLCQALGRDATDCIGRTRQTASMIDHQAGGASSLTFDVGTADLVVGDTITFAWADKPWPWWKRLWFWLTRQPQQLLTDQSVLVVTSVEANKIKLVRQ